MVAQDLRRLILLAYRVLGPSILGLSALAAAIEFGWIEDPFRREPYYTWYVMTVSATVFSLPVVALVALVGSVRFARDWPFVLPLWLVMLLLLLFLREVLSDNSYVDPVDGTVLTVVVVAAALAATIVGYWPHRS